jgi:hypothetical protein
MDAVDAAFIVVGVPQNAQVTPEGGRSDFVVTRVLRCAPLLLDTKVLTIPRLLPGDPQNPTPLLVFGDVLKGKPELYSGLPATPALVEYLRGLLAIDVKDHGALMRYCFDYLDHAEPEIATDALVEFMRSPDPEIRTTAGKLSPEKLRRWLRDGRATPELLRLAGYLLGVCGAPEDAALLRRLLEREKGKENVPLTDGVFTGYVLLAPKDGWAYLRDSLADSKNHFMVRFSALRAVRYFHTTHPGVLTEKQTLDALALLLDQEDMADLPIEDLRRWRCWKLTPKVLGLFEREAGKVPVTRRAIVRYALQCPDPEAARFIVKLRKTDPELVQDTEETLKLEAESARPGQ